VGARFRSSRCGHRGPAIAGAGRLDPDRPLPHRVDGHDVLQGRRRLGQLAYPLGALRGLRADPAELPADLLLRRRYRHRRAAPRADRAGLQHLEGDLRQRSHRHRLVGRVPPPGLGPSVCHLAVWHGRQELPLHHPHPAHGAAHRGGHSHAHLLREHSPVLRLADRLASGVLRHLLRPHPALHRHDLALRDLDDAGLH
jgi:hypothetical protein